ncbi:hypothetical protein PFISCL1PPCAC_3557, partial [Pristionchus fissidentatus]
QGETSAIRIRTMECILSSHFARLICGSNCLQKHLGRRTASMIKIEHRVNCAFETRQTICNSGRQLLALLQFLPFLFSDALIELNGNL